MKKIKDSTTKKKEEVQKRANKLDSNNNKNRKEKPLVIQGNKIVRDDGFEHRTSDETTENVE